MFETIRFEKSGALAWITLDRPQVHNAINLAMRDDLWQALQAIRDDPDVRCAVITGAGEQAFSSGADLTEFGMSSSIARARAARLQRDLWAFMLALDKPLLAALRGYALGAGLELALLCDIRIAADNAVLGLPEVGLGYMPAAGGTQTLPRTVLPGLAAQMLLSGEPVAAMAALQMGLVHMVTAPSRLPEKAEGLAHRLAALRPAAVAAAKQALRAAMDAPLGQGLALERALALRLRLASGSPG